MTVTPNKQPDNSRRIARAITEWVKSFAIAAVGVLIFTALIAQPVRVEGTSMENTLKDREQMIVTKFEYLLGDPERFDVVICRYPERGLTRFVKRIVGVPGDTVAVSGGVLYINGEPVMEPYIAYPPNYLLDEVTVMPGHYFVLGDNRSSSNDSHLPSVGQLSRDKIIGKVRFVVWPLSEIRAVN